MIKNILALALLLLTPMAFAQRQALPGSPAPDADLFDTDGNLHRLSDYKGRTVVVLFTGEKSFPQTWAVSDMWHYFADSKADSAYALISISNKNYKKWKTDVEKEKLPWLCLNDKKEQSGIFADYAIQTIPSIYIISPDGKIEYRCKGFDDNFFYSQAKQRGLAQPRSYDFGGGLIVKNPACEKSSFLVRDHIKKITITPEKTVIDFFIFRNEKFGRKKDLDTQEFCIETPDGKRYKQLKAEVAKESAHTPDGAYYFAITFEPVPQETEQFDILSDDKGSMQKTYTSVKLKYETQLDDNQINK
ncbi:MAG: redoxin domain-containing protein [Bacteroidales bacterium]|nr:redoxin domain-containing protein [Bacteroidales bacterium]